MNRLFPKDSDMLAAFEPWDGRTWLVELPADAATIPTNRTQVQASRILKRGKALTQWEAALAQFASCNPKAASPAARHWLSAVERAKCAGGD